MACAVGFIWISIQRQRRKSRLPLSFKLLRGPGETLRRRIAELDDDFGPRLVLFSAAVGVAVLVALFSGSHLMPRNPVADLAVVSLVFGTGTALLCWWLAGIARRRRNLLLGYLGERAVGEQLDRLRAEGYRVVHDFPAEANGHPFNLDHVVIGRTGLFVIETKTRRKGRARPGFKDHVVTFDGRQLVWPWGEDSHGIEQAAREARWLEEWVKTMTGRSIPVKPILALPGWWVELRAKPPFGILNEKNLVAFITGGPGGPELPGKEIDLLARQLEARCRDVED